MALVPLHIPRAITVICREVYLLWKFIDNDIWDTILPSLLIFFSSWIFNCSSWKDLPVRLLYSICYACLYIFTFCLSNQVNSVEEDRINKPYRPLPTGLLTRRQTNIRILLYNILFLTLGYSLQIFWASLGWQIVTWLLNFKGWSNHWITKNLLGMTIGTFLLFSAQWRIAFPYGPVPLSVLGYWTAMSAWAGLALPIQDFRDVAGDLTSGRRTLPIALGDKGARLIMIIHFLTISPLIFLGAMVTQMPLQDVFTQPAARLTLAVVVLIQALIGIRLWCFRSSVADHRTYLLFVALFCANLPMICWLT